MRIETTGDLMRSNIAFMSMTNTADLELKSFTDADGKTTTKTAPNGKPVFRAPLQALAVENGEPVRAEQNVSLALVEPLALTLGAVYELDGAVWITPYSAGNRVGISIIAERLVPRGERIPALNFEKKN